MAPRPLVIGHRGASGHRPEHTLASYVLAARLAPTTSNPTSSRPPTASWSPGTSPSSAATTDIAARPEFADRHTTRVVDGPPCTGWFVDDLTLAELRTLRVVERLPALRPGNTRFDGTSRCRPSPRSSTFGRGCPPSSAAPIGVYPETKNPGYFADRGVPLEPALVDALRGAGLDHPGAPVFVQSFDPASLRLLRSELRVPLVHLVDDDAPHLVDPREPRRDRGVRRRRRRAQEPRHPARRPPARSASPARSSTTRTPPGSPCTPSPSATRTPSCPPTCVGARATPNAATVSPSASPSSSAGVDGLFADHPDTAVAARALFSLPRI